MLAWSASDNRASTLARQAAIWLTVATVMVFLALANPVSRDEGAFLGSLSVARGLRPYADYLYLQTPLQLFIAQPLAWASAGWSFITLRVFTGLIGTLVLWLVYAVQVRLATPPRIAALSTFLLASCYSFQFGCGVYRNDALPMLFATMGTVGALFAIEKKAAAVAWGFAGLLFALAAGSKASYAVPAAGLGLYLLFLVATRRMPVSALLSYGVGGLVGTAPCIYLLFADTRGGYFFSIFTFNAHVLIDWYKARNLAWLTSPLTNLGLTVLILGAGPALGAIVSIVGVRLKRTPTPGGTASRETLLDVLIVSGLLAALLPTPSNFQYALPALPAVFIRLGGVGFGVRNRFGRDRLQFAAAALVWIGVLVGLSYGGVVAWRGLTRRHGLEVVEATEQAHWIGSRLSHAGASGFVTSLSPEDVLDSGYALDPRLSSGVFVFRSADQLPPALAASLPIMGPATLTQALDARPPAAIAVGGAGPLDAALRDYAVAHGYRREDSPIDWLALYVNPRSRQGRPSALAGMSTGKQAATGHS